MTYRLNELISMLKDEKRIVSLTYPIHNGMFIYHADTEPEINIIEARIEELIHPIIDESGATSGLGFVDKKYKSGRTELKITNHHGTHIDAPAHKIQGGKTIDEYPISKFINSATLVDLTSENLGLLRRQKREISKNDVKSCFDFRKYLGIGALVFYTGFCDEVWERERRPGWGGSLLIGQDKTNFEKTFPYFSQEAAKYVVDNVPSLNIIGIDSFAVDPSGSNSEVHRIFFEKNILPLETLVNLGELKEKVGTGIFTLFCVPLVYQGADAAQTRVYAVLDKRRENDTC